jgi:hypothetical protein
MVESLKVDMGDSIAMIEECRSRNAYRNSGAEMPIIDRIISFSILA